MTDERSPSEEMIRKARESAGQPVPATPPEAPDPAPPPPPDPFEAATQPPMSAPRARPPAPDVPADHRTGFLLGLAAAAVGAAVWGFVLAKAELQSWLLGIGIGYLVAFAVVRGAGRVTSNVKVMVVVLTVVGVFAGEVLGWALQIQDLFGRFDLKKAFELYFDNLNGDSAFALGAAVVGSFVALSVVNKPAKA
jgi:hypothetical protein